MDGSWLEEPAEGNKEHLVATDQSDGTATRLVARTALARRLFHPDRHVLPLVTPPPPFRPSRAPLQRLTASHKPRSFNLCPATTDPFHL